MGFGRELINGYRLTQMGKQNRDLGTFVEQVPLNAKAEYAG